MSFMTALYYAGLRLWSQAHFFFKQLLSKLSGQAQPIKLPLCKFHQNPLCKKQFPLRGYRTAVDVKKHIEEDYGIAISANTVRRALRKCGLKAKEKVAKPTLTARHARARLAFAKAHQHWTALTGLLLYLATNKNQSL